MFPVGDKFTICNISRDLIFEDRREVAVNQLYVTRRDIVRADSTVDSVVIEIDFCIKGNVTRPYISTR